MDEEQIRRESHQQSYLAKLKDPRWQKIQRIVFERDKFSCQFCRNTDGSLHVHHLEYVSGRDPWDYPPESLITVCQSCHEDEVIYRTIAEDQLLDYLRAAGLSADHLDQLAWTFSMALFPFAKGEFAAFFDWFMNSSAIFNETLRNYRGTTLSGELEGETR